MSNKELADWLRKRLDKHLFIDMWQRPLLEALLKKLMMSRKDIHPICKC